jgi:hypothetical protein
MEQHALLFYGAPGLPSSYAPPYYLPRLDSTNPTILPDDERGLFDTTPVMMEREQCLVDPIS